MKLETRDIFFELLRAGMWGRSADLKGVQPAAAQWADILRTTREQTVMGTVFDGIATLPAECMPPRELKITMAADVAVIEDRHVQMRAAARAAAELLDANGLTYMLLKGLAVGESYPVPQHRVSGDIDLWLPAADCEKAAALLFKDTFVKIDKRHLSGQFKGIHFENHFELSHNTMKRYLEFSRTILDDKIRLPLAKVTIDGYDIKCPSPTFHALFIIEHLAFHLINGLGLRQICDWAVFMQRHAEEIDREVMALILKKARFNRITNIYSIICIDHLGMPEACAPLPLDRSRRAMKDADLVLGLVMEGGNFGRYYSSKHSRSAHLKLPALHRKYRSLTSVLKNYTQYKLVSRNVFWMALYTMFRSPFRRHTNEATITRQK